MAYLRNFKDHLLAADTGEDQTAELLHPNVLLHAELLEG